MFSQTRTRSPECECQHLEVCQRDCLGIHTVPVGDVLVGDAGSDIEHDDAALSVDVVAITKTTELLLSSGVPDIELDLTKVLGCVLVAVCLRIVRLAGWK